MSKHSRPNGTVLQPRDYTLLQGLLDSRLMTLKHAAVLHFEGKIEAAKKRLQKLHVAGFIHQRTRRPQDPAVYTLGRAGYFRLKQEGMLDPASDTGWLKFWKTRQIGELILRHELAVMDVKTAFVTAIQKRPDLELIEMSVTPDRHAFRAVEAVPNGNGMIRFKSIIAKPDGFLHVHESGGAQPAVDHFFFLEVDRGTETLSRLLQKARNYGQHYRKGGFAAGLGHQREEYRRFPFRVLMVFRTAARRDNVGRKLLAASAPIKSQVWLATMLELKADPLSSIWLTPKHYEGGPRDHRSESAVPIFPRPISLNVTEPGSPGHCETGESPKGRV